MTVKKLELASGLKFPCFFPGPMEGVMTPLFCRAFHELDLTDGWLTPYYRITTNIPKDGKLSKFLQPFQSKGLPVIAQLMGTDPELLSKTAMRMAFLGTEGINLNFACPSKQVLRSGAGGALLRNVGFMLEILQKIKESLPQTSVSAKIRCGYDSWQECEDIIPALTESGTLDFIAVHFRTVKENYTRISTGNERMRRIVSLSKSVPVIGSGDIFSVTDADSMLKAGCSGVMAARGLLRDPFLINRLRKNREYALPPEEGRVKFFMTIQKIARSDARFSSRAKFLEYAAMMWGAGSEQFAELKELSLEKILDFNF